MKKLFFLILMELIIFQLHAQTPIVTNIMAPASGQVFEKYQICFNINPETVTGNVFDPDDIDIQVLFTSPDGTVYKTPAFWMQDYNRNLSSPDPTGFTNPSYCEFAFLPSGNINNADPAFLTPTTIGLNTTCYPWKVRFSPNKPGLWGYSFQVTNYSYVYSLIPGGTFNVSASSNKGYIQTTGRNFSYNDGTIFYPVGTNGVNGGSLVYNRINYLYVMSEIDSIAHNQGNYLRLFITPAFFGIEWETLTNYGGDRQKRAFDLDDIVSYAEQKGVYLQLCLEDVPQYDTSVHLYDNGWAYNPYNFPVGSNPSTFFTDATKIHDYQKKLRYIIARWGYATSIFSFELFNEIDLYDGGASSTYGSTTTGANAILNWINNDAVSVCRGYNDHHMFTISFASPWASTLPSSSSQIGDAEWLSYYTDHHYTPSYNIDHQINYLSNRAKTLYNDRPYIFGEFGSGNVNCGFFGSCGYKSYTSFMDGSVAALYSEVEFHNGVWASALSGGSGTGMYWASSPFNTCWGGQTEYLLPLTNFLSGEDMDLSHSTPITNQCAGVGGYAFAAADNCGVPANTSPIPTADLNQVISTNDDNNLEVFALRYPNKVLGWVNNKQNYWYNFPHTPITGGFACSSLIGSTPTVSNLYGKQITIPGLQCDGQYKIEFYSTYPKYNINGTGQEDGGIINSFTIYAIAHCGNLTINIPPLKSIIPPDGSIAPYAPDYAFKATLVSAAWGHGLVGPYDGTAQHLAIDGGGGQVGYRGNDGSLNCYFRGGGSYTWSNSVLSSGSSEKVQYFGDIVRGISSNSYSYRGVDNRLQMCYYDGGWVHQWLTDWSNSSQNVAGAIGSDDAGDKIFYRGIDGKLHEYYQTGSGWVHTIIFINSFDYIAPESSLAVDGDGGLIAFKGTDGRLHTLYQPTSASTWYHDYGASDYVDATVKINSSADVIFYKGTDGKLHERYYLSGSWNSRLITLSGGTTPVDIYGYYFDVLPGYTYDNAQIYFTGTDGQIKVVYASGGDWVEDYLICDLHSGDRNIFNGSIVCANGTVVYDGAYNYLQFYAFDMCGNTIPPGSPREADTVTKDNVSISSKIATDYETLNNINFDDSSINHISENVVYPNPFKDIITILPANFNTHIKLTNVLGEVLYERDIIGNETQISTSAYPPGVYILQLNNTNDESTYYKLIKN